MKEGKVKTNRTSWKDVTGKLKTLFEVWSENKEVRGAKNKDYTQEGIRFADGCTALICLISPCCEVCLTTASNESGEEIVVLSLKSIHDDFFGLIKAWVDSDGDYYYECRPTPTDQPNPGKYPIEEPGGTIVKNISHFREQIDQILNPATKEQFICFPEVPATARK